MGATDLPEHLRLRIEPLGRIDPRTLYLLIQLRERVFSLEQQADVADLDGRELEEGTALIWLEERERAEAGQGGGDAGLWRPIAHARVLTDADAMRIGRMVVAPEHRGGGWGRVVFAVAMEHCRAQRPDLPVRISAQAYLEQWYQWMGFATVGERYQEAGIEHVPMLLPPREG